MVQQSTWGDSSLGSLVGGFGLAFAFTAMGYLGVPRRQFLPVNTGLPFTITLDYQTWLVLAFFFAVIVASAQIPFIWNLLKTLTGPNLAKPVTTPATLEESLAIPVPTPMVRSADLSDSSNLAKLDVGGGAPPGIGIGASLNQGPKRQEEA